MKTKIILGIVAMVCVICATTVSASSATPCSVVTIREPPHLIPIITNYNETTLDTVQHFLDHLEPCPWGGACCIHARYVSLEAEKVGLHVGEVTIRDWDRARAKRMVMDGHRVNTFTDGDIRYYTCNLYAGDTRIVSCPELQVILTRLMDGA